MSFFRYDHPLPRSRPWRLKRWSQDQLQGHGSPGFSPCGTPGTVNNSIRQRIPDSWLPRSCTQCLSTGSALLVLTICSSAPTVSDFSPIITKLLLYAIGLTCYSRSFSLKQVCSEFLKYVLIH